ncbi:MAG: histidine kinase [Acidobacteria bacterium]|nr:histidine kinase [Acidobacteriota bacterium]
MTAANAADVLNLVGFVTGTALYAMLLVLVLRGGARGRDQAGRTDWVPLATALLGLAWNLGELASYALPRLGLAADSVGLSAVSFPALGFLAAVVVHSVARDFRHGRLVVLAAYALSVVAAVLHARTIVSSDPAPSTLAFQVLTVSFGLLIVPLAALTRSQPNGRRALWVLALALVAVSATHLGSFHTGADSWWMQLVGHHAAIPLAFAILYQDYRFALGDLFLKQALTLLAIVGIAVAGYSVVSAVPPGPAAVGLTLALWVATALVAPLVRRAVVRFVDAVLLGRVNYAVLRQALARDIEEQASIAGVMDAVCSRLAEALNARRVWWSEGADPSPGPRPAYQRWDAGAEAPALRTTVVPTTEAPHPIIHVGELTGGRRLLSDDEALLDAAVGLAARRVDAIRLRLERYETELREEEMQTLAAEAELRALRAQINPHFLFNALTTIGYLIETAPPRALRTLMRLTALLRGVLRPEGEFTTLGRELDLVEHYLDIERERFEERLRVRIDVPEALRTASIPALVVQPLVENAIKHGVAPSAGGGDVEVLARDETGLAGRVLRITVRNTGAPMAGGRGDGEHLGLDNVERRLAGHYGPTAALTLGRDATGATIAELCLPLGTLETKDEHAHAEALAGRAGRR